NWMVLRALRSVCTTTLATLRWTKISPGGRSTIWVEGTRESAQPIQRYFGACCLDRLSKNAGALVVISSDQRRLLASRSFREFIRRPWVSVVGARAGRSSRRRSVWHGSHAANSQPRYAVGAKNRSEAGASPRHADILGFGEKAQRLRTAFAAMTGMLHAAERRAQVAQHPAVDPDDAEIQPRGDAVRARGIGGPERGGQAVVGGVGDGHGVVLVIEGNQRHHGAEDFLAVGGAVERQAFGRRGRDEPAVAAAPVVAQVERVAAGQDGAALVACAFDAVRDLGEVRLGNHGAQVGVRIVRVADFQRFDARQV